jgi:hypothetical protein
MKRLLFAVLAGVALALAVPAHADPPAAPTPTPVPPAVESTGGAQGGTNAGSSCASHSGQLQAPAPRTDSLWWAEENDWPANAPRTPPQTSTACSR